MRLPKVVLLLAVFLLAVRLPIFAQLASDPPTTACTPT